MGVQPSPGGFKRWGVSFISWGQETWISENKACAQVSPGGGKGWRLWETLLPQILGVGTQQCLNVEVLKSRLQADLEFTLSISLFQG